MVQVAIVLYFAILLISLFYKSGVKQSNLSDYVLAGRKLSLIPFVATLVTTSYGWVFGIGEMYYQMGISAWLLLSLPYTLFSILIGFGMGKKLRMHKVNSIPELLNKHYGKNAARLGALAVLVFISPLMYVHMTASILEHSLGMPFLFCVILALAFSTLYLYKGGLGSIAKNDSIKFLLMFISFLSAAVYLYSTQGLESFHNLDPSLLSFSLSDHYLEFFTWLLLASIVLADPSYHQRIYAAKDENTARKGIMLAVVCWTIFDFLAASLALFGTALLPELAQPDQVYLLLADGFLPEILTAFLYLGFLATIMSTADSFLFLSAQTLAIDLLGYRRYPQKAIRLSLFAISILCFGLLLIYKDHTVVDIFLDFTPFVVSILVVPVVLALTKSWRMKSDYAFVMMLLSLISCVLFSVYSPIANMSGVFMGLLTPILFTLFLKILRKKAFH